MASRRWQSRTAATFTPCERVGGFAQLVGLASSHIPYAASTAQTSTAAASPCSVSACSSAPSRAALSMARSRGDRKRAARRCVSSRVLLRSVRMRDSALVLIGMAFLNSKSFVAHHGGRHPPLAYPLPCHAVPRPYPNTQRRPKGRTAAGSSCTARTRWPSAFPVMGTLRSSGTRFGTIACGVLCIDRPRPIDAQIDLFHVVAVQFSGARC
jgi:hypothetical protein